MAISFNRDQLAMNAALANIFVGIVISIFLPEGLHAQGVMTTIPTTMSISPLIMVDDVLLAGSSRRGLFRSSDNGTTWTVSNTGLPPLANSTAFAVIDSLIFISLYYPAGVYVSSDKGYNWFPVNSGFPEDSFFSVHTLAVIDTKLYAGTDNGVYRSVDRGKNWESITTTIKPYTRVMSFANSDSRLCFYNNYYNAVFFSADNGVTWEEKISNIPSRPNIRALVFQDTYLIAGTDKGIFRSIDNGANWLWATSGLPPNITVHAFCVVGNTIFAGTDSGVFLSSSKGARWTALDSELSSTSVYSLAASSAYLFAGSTEGRVWRFPLIPTSATKALENTHASLAWTIKPVNRCHSDVVFTFSLLHADNVLLRIYSLSGSAVATLVDNHVYAGTHTMLWPTSDIAPGLYTVRLQAGTTTIAKTLSLVR
jgi:hypothetical protein